MEADRALQHHLSSRRRRALSRPPREGTSSRPGGRGRQSDCKSLLSPVCARRSAAVLHSIVGGVGNRSLPSIVDERTSKIQIMVSLQRFGAILRLGILRGSARFPILGLGPPRSCLDGRANITNMSRAELCDGYEYHPAVQHSCSLTPLAATWVIHHTHRDPARLSRWQYLPILSACSTPHRITLHATYLYRQPPQPPERIEGHHQLDLT